MFNSSVLDVAIRMVFVYLLLSSMCSAANEIVECRLKNRAQDLEGGLRDLVRDRQLSLKKRVLKRSRRGEDSLVIRLPKRMAAS